MQKGVQQLVHFRDCKIWTRLESGFGTALITKGITGNPTAHGPGVSRLHRLLVPGKGWLCCLFRISTPPAASAQNGSQWPRERKDPLTRRPWHRIRMGGSVGSCCFCEGWLAPTEAAELYPPRTLMASDDQTTSEGRKLPGNTVRQLHVTDTRLSDDDTQRVHNL